MQSTIEQFIRAQLQEGMDPATYPVQDFTCFGCDGGEVGKDSRWDVPGYPNQGKFKCTFAWDLYNTHGDCLAFK